jgi:hypothetical protein
MTRTLRNGRRKGDGRFVRMLHSELDTDAWRALSGNAVKLLIALRGRHFGSNNGGSSTFQVDLRMWGSGAPSR